ncbi:MAG: hypothetical protein KAI79_05085 [Bacteroidales bacterium]|nr:hypothetical protein [Bacteroidales bacterium]
MKKFTITDVKIEETYGGVYALESYKWWNERHIGTIEEKVERYFGSGRKIWKDTAHLDLKKELPHYFFIAWLSADNEHDLTDDEGDNYDGFHLFVAGHTEDINDVIATINEIGDEKFDTESVGFFY